jgi:uncharacterized protein YegJ (DUF2314 family)
MRYPLIMALCSILLISCGTEEKKASEQTEDPNIVHINKDDDQMNLAKQKARDSWDHFLTVLREKTYDANNASVKLGYSTSDGNIEHIWATDLHWTAGNLYAVIANDPQKIIGMQMGDTVLVTKNKLSDWLYSVNGVMKGGYTIRVIRDQKTPEERKAFDEQFGLTIEEE